MVETIIGMQTTQAHFTDKEIEAQRVKVTYSKSKVSKCTYPPPLDQIPPHPPPPLLATHAKFPASQMEQLLGLNLASESQTYRKSEEE